MNLGVYPMKNEKVDESRRLLSQTYYIYKHEDSPLEWDGKSFSHLKGVLGTIIGFSINKDLEKKGLQVEEAPSVLANLLKLKHGRLAAVINYDSQTDVAIDEFKEDFSVIKKLEIPFIKKFKYLMFSHGFNKQNRALVQNIWDGLERIRVSGELNKIAERYAQ